MIILLILITSSHDNVCISLGENCCWSLFIFKNAQDPGRERSSFFSCYHRKSYFTLTLLFATSLLNLRAWNKLREILRNWSTNDKTSRLDKNFQDAFFCVFLLPSILPCLNFAAFLSWWLSCPCVIILSFLNPLSHNIHTQILQTDLYTFSSRISWENLIKDQSIFP